jgi:hypothetical protein
MEHAKHIIRAVLLLLVSTAVFVVVRHFAIPESYGAHGPYRFDSVAEFAAQSPVHGPPGACTDCHDDEAETVSGGKHGSVSCEVCHAPLGNHVRDGEKFADMPARRSYTLCGLCHRRLAARPKDFPQVVLMDHVREKGGDMSETACLECHDAHNPSE